jgi:hypothetical protein
MLNAPKTIEMVPCKLSAEESHLKSKQLCQLAIDRAELEQEKKSAASAIKAAIDSKEEKINDLVKEVHSGEELRPVECYERPRYIDNMVDLIRTDTGAVVRTRAMHPTERQTALDMGDYQISGDDDRPKRRKTSTPEGAH